jgi:capsular polysaccharide transport system ATP-binding protein
MIEVHDLVKIYQTRNGSRRVLDKVCFKLDKGRNVGILGHNGAGKSTLIRLLAGAEKPTAGRIDRRMSVSWPLAFGGAFQSHLTGLDNLRFVARIYGRDFRQLRPFVEEFTELGDYLSEPVEHYSTGMVTRLAFALSMAIEFDCFLIDEVLVVGDKRFHDRCHEELFHKRRDRSFILVTHDANSIRTYCESVCVLEGGKLRAFESVDEGLAWYEELTAARTNNLAYAAVETA